MTERAETLPEEEIGDMDFYLVGIQMFGIQIVVQYSNCVWIQNHWAIEQLLTIQIPASLVFRCPLYSDGYYKFRDHS